MADNPEPNNGQNKLTLVSDRFKTFFGQIIQKKKRSPVEYYNCPGHHQPKTPRNRVDPPAALNPAAAAAVNDDDPDDEMANEADSDEEFLAATAVNDDDSDDEMANEADSDEEFLAAAAVNNDDPDEEMANVGSPDEEIPAAAVVNEEVANVGDPDEEILGVEDGGEEMPAEMREMITERLGGYRVQMIIEKKLTATDMRSDQGRLLMPAKQTRVQFLTEAEERFLEHRGGNGEGGNGLNYMDSFVVGPDLAENPIRFKKWLVGTRLVNCWMNKWNPFVKTYGLKTGNKVRIWAFRVDRRDDEHNIEEAELRFALIKL